MCTRTYTNIKGQGHLLTLVQGRSDSTFSNFFSLETAMPIEANFHMGPSWDWGTKVCSNGPGHMTKMAAMPIHSKKKLKKSSSLEPKGRWPWILVCTIGYSNTTKFIQMMTLCWPGPILRQGQIWSLMLLCGKKVKQLDFSETIVVNDVKVGRCSQPNEYMKVYEYQRSMSFIDFCPRSFRLNISNFIP